MRDISRRLSGLDRKAMASHSSDRTSIVERDYKASVEAFRLSTDDLARRRAIQARQIHLELLAFCATVIRDALHVFDHEDEQFAACWEAKRRQIGRCLAPTETFHMRAASRAIWSALAHIPAGQGT